MLGDLQSNLSENIYIFEIKKTEGRNLQVSKVVTTNKMQAQTILLRLLSQ